MMSTTLPPQAQQSQHIRPEQVADYLLEHRDFLQHHPAVFAGLELPHTVGENTVSLQAKQVSALREQVVMHEAQLSTLLANARNSETIAKGLHTLTLSLLAQRSMRELPLAAQEALAHVFGLQDSAVRLWGTEALYEKMECNKPVSEDVKTFADGLKQPYVGPNANFSAAHWLQRDTASLAMVALRVTPNGKAFGLLVIGSQDPRHFTADKSTDFLAQLGQVFSASLGRMLPPFS
jgi:uncharacterized protein YigA (DUF484 family)